MDGNDSVAALLLWLGDQKLGENIVIYFWQCQCYNCISSMVVEGMVTAQADIKTSPGADLVAAEVLFECNYVIFYYSPILSSFFLFHV